MTDNERPLIPEGSDAQIEEHSHRSSSEPATPEERLVEDLAGLYHAYPLLEHTLERAWKRLEQPAATSLEERQEMPTRLERNPDRGEALPTRQNTIPLFRRAAPLSLRIASLVAMILLVVLVGSLVAGVILVRQRGETSKGGTSTNQPTATLPAPAAPLELYIGTTAGIYKLDSKTGTVLWKYVTGKGGAGAVPAVVNKVAYFSDQQGGVYALKAADGSLLWSYQRPGGQATNPAMPAYTSTTPAVDKGIVYIGGSTHGFVDALKAADGSLLWRTQVTEHPSQYAQFETTTAVVANGMVYVAENHYPALDGSYSDIFGLRASDGKILWQTSILNAQLVLQAEVMDSILYASSKNINDSTSYVSAYQAETGALLWQSPNLNAGSNALPTIANGVAYLGSSNGYLYALRTTNGSLLWRVSVTPGSLWVSPQVSNGLLYAIGSSQPGGSIDSGLLFALDSSSGSVRWSSQLGGSSLTVVDGILYDVARSQLLAFNASDGSLLWKAPFAYPGEEIGGSVTAAP